MTQNSIIKCVIYQARQTSCFNFVAEPLLQPRNFKNEFCNSCQFRDSCSEPLPMAVDPVDPVDVRSRSTPAPSAASSASTAAVTMWSRTATGRHGTRASHKTLARLMPCSVKIEALQRLAAHWVNGSSIGVAVCWYIVIYLWLIYVFYDIISYVDWHIVYISDVFYSCMYTVYSVSWCQLLSLQWFVFILLRSRLAARNHGFLRKNGSEPMVNSLLRCNMSL